MSSASQTSSPPLSLSSIIRGAALLACAAVAGMLGLFVITKVGQDPLQFVHPSAEYTAILLRGPAALRAGLALDNLFIVFYVTLFVAMGVELLRRGAPPIFTKAAVALLCVVGTLDLIENLHFLVMLARAEQGVPIPDAEIALQVLSSWVKFHLSYLGLFFLGLSIPETDGASRLLARLSRYLQLPVGVLIYVAPRSVAVPLVFVRFGYFLLALILAAVALGGDRSTRRSEGVSAVGSGVPG